MFGHVIAAGYGNYNPIASFFNAVMTTYGWKNLCIVYDTEGLSVFRFIAQITHGQSRAHGLVSTLKSVNSSSPDSCSTLLRDFQQVARGEYSVLNIL